MHLKTALFIDFVPFWPKQLNKHNPRISMVKTFTKNYFHELHLCHFTKSNSTYSAFKSKPPDTNINHKFIQIQKQHKNSNKNPDHRAQHRLWKALNVVAF
jgi:hypothetical protein